MLYNNQIVVAPGISGIFCLIRLTTEEALSQYVESELPLSTDDSFSISAVNIQLLKINKETGLVDLKLEVCMKSQSKSITKTKIIS